jgi:hypothetical protein
LLQHLPSSALRARGGQVCGFLAAISLAERYRAMSDGLIAFGLIVCLLAMIALMPPFDGRWER